MELPPNKRVLYPGKGDLPDLVDGCKIIFHYRVELCDEDRTCIDDSKKPYPNGYGQPMELILGKKFKLPVWETCLRTMRVEEVSSFLLMPKDLVDYPFVSQHLRDFSKKAIHPNEEHVHHGCMGMTAARGGLGYPHLDAWLKNPAPLMFTFDVLKILWPNDYEHESWTLNSEQKLASVPQLREEGNDLFRNGRVVEAYGRYCEALSRLDTLLLNEKPGEPEWVDLDQQKIPIYLNLAQCKLRLNEFYPAIEAACEVLKRDPDNVKGLYRRAKAHTGAWNFDLARADYDRVKMLDASMMKVVDKELEQMSSLEKSCNADEANRLKMLFKS